MEGRCQCGLIRFTTPLPAPLSLYICHCTECRRQSASAFGITAAFPAFEIPAPHNGAVGKFTRPPDTDSSAPGCSSSGGGGSGGGSSNTDCYFCTRCGVRLLHQAVDAATGKPAATVAVKAGCLTGLTREMMRSAHHIWTRSAVVEIPAGAKAYEQGDDG